MITSLSLVCFLKFGNSGIQQTFNPYQAGWKENHATFISELKNLKAVSLTSFSRALKEAFDLLNVHRLHTGIDYYGQVGGVTVHCRSHGRVCGSMH